MKSLRVSIIGAGAVGATTAYALLLQHTASEIILVDCDEDKCTGQVFDLTDVLPFSMGSIVKGGTLKQAAQADVIIAAGQRQKPGQDRCDLFEKNASIVQSLMQEMQPIQKDALVIVVSNPVDSMTLCAQRFSGLPQHQVVGSGTYLDSQRLRCFLSQELQLAEESIDACVIGEHGATGFPVWSQARAGGVAIDLPNAIKKVIAKKVREKAQEIIVRKQATYFGVATCVAQLCRIIMFNQKLVVPVSWYQKDFGVCLSMPVVLSAQGIEGQIELPLDAIEKQLFQSSVKELKGFCDKVACL